MTLILSIHGIYIKQGAERTLHTIQVVLVGKANIFYHGNGIFQIYHVSLTSFYVNHNIEKLRITNYFYIFWS